MILLLLAQSPLVFIVLETDFVNHILVIGWPGNVFSILIGWAWAEVVRMLDVLHCRTVLRWVSELLKLEIIAPLS